MISFRPPYAGIGSRSTPKPICLLMRSYASHLERDGYVLRSGGAHGADAFFELGVLDVLSNAEIYLPKKGWNGNTSPNFGVCERAMQIARKYHPTFDRLGEFAKLLIARNGYQVLGQDLDDPVKFVLCWTADGEASGGTGQAIRIARSYDIPVFNLRRGTDRVDFEREYVNA